MDKCTRFAPSPTGFLHVGSARTALFCWLYARKYQKQGTFILRIEDTDIERSSQEAVDAILSGMDWLGLTYDKGPYYQTQRFERYREVIQQLLDINQAYRCNCSKERIEELRDSLILKKQKPRYDGCCRDKNIKDEGQPHVIRFKNPQGGSVEFQDAVRGFISIQNSELDDLIIARTDGTPTYNLTVVVDDLDMQVSMVIRGEDHITNTPRQINIFKSLNAQIPNYAHIPMILGDDGKRLSKRHGAVSVLQYREDGYLPEALLNYLVRLGWSHGDQEIFSKEEMIEFFDLNAVQKSAAAFNTEKLNWLNQHYLKTLPSDDLASRLSLYMQSLGISIENGPKLEDIVILQRERVKTLVEMAEKSKYFYEDFEQIDPTAANKHLRLVILEPLQELYEKFSQQQDWTGAEIHKSILCTAEQFSLKLGKLAQPLRVAITGNTISPSIDVTLALVGRERSLHRLAKALKWIAGNQN